MLVSSWRAFARMVGVVVCSVVVVCWMGASAWGASLPDGREWELVSPGGKLGNEVIAESTRTQASAGESATLPAAAVFTSLGGFGDVRGTGVGTQYVAERTGGAGTSGWVTHAITPRQEPLAFIAAANGFEAGYRLFSDDLTKGIFRSWSPLTDAPNVANVPNLYVRDDLRDSGEGFYRLVTDAPSLLSAAVGMFPWIAGNTPDMQHLVFESKQNLVAGARGRYVKLYKMDGAVTRLVTAGPSCPGGQAGATAGPCSSAGQGASLPRYTPRVLSADGSRVTFMTPVSSVGTQVTAAGVVSRILQLDDRGTSTGADDAIFQLSTSERRTPDPTAPARYEIASVDSSRVFFSSDEALTDAATGGGQYLWERQPTDEQQSVTVSATGGTYRLTFHSQITHGEGDLTSGSNEVSGVSNGSFAIGQTVSAPGILPAGTTIVAMGAFIGGPATRTLTLSNSATASATQLLKASVDSTTGPLPLNANPAQVQSALESLAGIGAGNVHVAGTPGAYTVTFTGALAGVNVDLLSADESGLDPGGSVAVAQRGPDIHNLTQIARGAGGNFGAVGASSDGHHLYITGLAGLVNGEPVSPRALYYWQDADRTPGGTLSVVGGLSTGDPPSLTDFFAWPNSPKLSRVTPDGRTLVFEVSDGTGLAPRYSGLSCPLAQFNPNGDPASGCSQVFVYRADSSSPTIPDVKCVSCPRLRATPVDNAYLNIRRGAAATVPGEYVNRALSDNGRYVFFSSVEALVDEDTNGKFDAYEYDVATDTVHLLSTGKDTSDSFFVDASADGHDAFFVTRAQLVGWDTDNANDLYDARIRGGVPEPPARAPECTGDACQGPGASGPVAAALSSRLFQGLGNEPTTKPPRRPIRCKHGQTKRTTRGTTRCVRHKKKKKTHKHRRNRR